MYETVSPRPDYVCPFCEEVHRLGETDCDGLPIGWIENDGTPFISRQERDVILGSAALREALLFWGKTGGIFGNLDDPHQILLRNRVLPEHFDEVLDEFDSDVEVVVPIWQDCARQAAQNN